MSDRFGRPSRGNDDDNNDDYMVGERQCTNFMTIFTRRYIIWLCLLYLGLYMMARYSTIYDNLPGTIISETDARVVCVTTAIQVENGIRAGLLTYGNADKIEIQLYTTSITRSINCVDTKEIPHLLQYKDDYLNISTVDVNKVLQSLSEQYHIGKSFVTWYYERDCYWMSRMRQLDRNCLSLDKALNQEDYRNALDDALFGMCIHLGIIGLLFIYIMIHLILRENGYRWSRCFTKKEASFM